MNNWTRFSTSPGRIAIAVTVGIASGLLIHWTNKQLKELSNTISNRPWNRLTVIGEIDTEDLTDMSLSAQLRRMSDEDRAGHIKNLSAIADAICSKD